MTSYYQRDALERTVVTKGARLLRCDGVHRGARCNQVLAEVAADFVPRAGGPVVQCRRCGKRHTL